MARAVGAAAAGAGVAVSRPDQRTLRERDRAARAAACEFGAPLAVEAGAGTGKTATLVARVVCWCLGPGWERAEQLGPGTPRDALAARVLGRVAAITFTEAAAAEMALRIGEAFSAVERGSTPIGVERGRLARIADGEERARALLAALDHLVVRTIHAFCRRLLAAHPLEAGFHPDFTVDPDREATRRIARETLEARLREGYGAGDRELLELAADGFGPPEIEEALLALLDAGVEPERLGPDPCAPDRAAVAAGSLAEAVAQLRAGPGGALARGEGPPGRGRALAAKLDETLALVRAGLPLAELALGLRELWGDRDRGTLGEWARGRLRAAERRALGGSADAFGAAAARLRARIDGLRACAPRRLAAVRRVLRPLLDETRRELRLRGIVSFSDLLSGARALLERHPSVAERVRDGMDQLLVDEFQDTDEVQCAIVEQLALCGPRERRPELFLVGDPKQSIYGWRRADLRAYERFLARVEQEGGTRHRLAVSYRATPALLDEVERVLEPALRPEPGVQPEFQPLVADRAQDPSTPVPVEYWVSWPLAAATPGAAPDAPPRPALRARVADVAELEARALAWDLRGLHDARGVAWRDVGVLFRSRGDLDTYLAALRDAGVPYAVEGDRAYFQRREIVEAVALVRCILDPNDQLSLLTVLRSAWVGVPDAALIPLWTRELPGRIARLDGPDPVALDGLRRRIRDAASAVPDVPGLARVAGWEHALESAVEVLARLRQSFRCEPGDVFVERVRALSLLEATEAARHQGAYRLANLQRFFRGLALALADGRGGTHALLRRLRRSVAEALEEEEARPPETGEDAVRVLTIHQAKGLDFRHVYLVQLHRESGGPVPTASPVLAEVDGALEYRLLGAASPGLHVALAQRERVARAELGRTLYVAMTRARDRLVLVGRLSTSSPEPTAAARTHAELLHARRGGLPPLEPLFAELAAAGEADAVRLGARWRFPALETAPPQPPLTATEHALPQAERIRADRETIARRREQAVARMARPAVAAASAGADEEHGRARASGPGRVRAPEPERLSRAISRAVGSAVHRALERLDPSASADAVLARGRATVRFELACELEGEALARGIERAEALLEGFARGPLLARLRRLGDRVVARELPLLATPPAADSGPVDSVQGAIDLLYREPGTGEWVVADFKTDRVEGDAELAERARAYASQGEVYTRAVREALGLDREPRFELWFLHPGRIERPGPEPSGYNGAP